MRKVITYGTFDLFHRGHYNILKRAKEEGDYLIVGVTGESYDMERGKLSVQDSLATRVENVKKTGFADQIIVEEYLGQKISDILKYDVDVLVIGSDWRGKFDHLRKYCEVKYLERTKDISSTQLREESLDIYKLGIVTDGLGGENVVDEAERVSGIHVECVFCENALLADQFANEKDLRKGYSDYTSFLYDLDIVYIDVERSQRKTYIEQAIRAGKHVICDIPYALDEAEDLRLRKLAEDFGVVLMENITTLHLQAFEPLIWMARGNLIGTIRSVRCSLTKKHMQGKTVSDFFDLICYPLCVVLKILGTEYEDFHYKLVRNDDGAVSYALLTVSYENAVATIEVSTDSEIEDGIQLLGSTGVIDVPDSWWDIGYFTLRNKSEKQCKHYSFNFEGNGFRYLMRSALSAIKTKSAKTHRVTDAESRTILKMLSMMQQEK